MLRSLSTFLIFLELFFGHSSQFFLGWRIINWNLEARKDLMAVGCCKLLELVVVGVLVWLEYQVAVFSATALELFSHINSVANADIAACHSTWESTRSWFSVFEYTDNLLMGGSLHATQ